MKTLDSVVAERKMSGPILLKEEVQGFELEVLRGANETLRNTEVILLEVSTLRRCSAMGRPGSLIKFGREDRQPRGGAICANPQDRVAEYFNWQHFRWIWVDR